MRIVIAVVVLSLLGSQVAQACSCGKYPSANEAREGATVVFEGTVVERWPELVRMDLAGYEDVDAPSQRYTFAISRLWKGPAQRQITILEGLSNCSHWFETGKAYLVFASPHETEAGSLDSYKCGGPTVEASRAQDHFAQLGRPIATFPSTINVQLTWRYRTKQHLSVYFWTGIAVLKYTLRHPSKVGWRIGLVILGALAITLTLVLETNRTVKSPFLRIGAVALISLACGLHAVLAAGFFYLRLNYWTKHLLEGWSPPF